MGRDLYDLEQHLEPISDGLELRTAILIRREELKLDDKINLAINALWDMAEKNADFMMSKVSTNCEPSYPTSSRLILLF